MTFGFLSGSKNLCKHLSVPCEVSFLHGNAGIHWVAKSCTTTANRWLFRDSQLSMRTLWSAVMKSPKFSARGTAPPLRLLHFQIHPAYNAFPRNNPGNTFFPSWWLLDRSFAVKGQTQPMKRMEWLVLWMVAQNVSHKASSHQTINVWKTFRR